MKCIRRQLADEAKKQKMTAYGIAKASGHAITPSAAADFLADRRGDAVRLATVEAVALALGMKVVAVKE